MTRAGVLHDGWSRLPFGTLDAIIGTGRCLVLAPHQDDESLGCGGLIAACVADGRPPLVLFLTDGTGSHPGSRSHPPKQLGALRQREALDALKTLGVTADHVRFLGLRDTQAPREGPAFERAVADMVSLATEHQTTAILAPWRFDPHCDHEAAAMMAEQVARETRIRLVSYPVWGWTLPAETSVPEGARNGFRFDITPHLAAKRRAIAAHRSQHGQVIMDDPSGFELPRHLLTRFHQPNETFLLS